MCAKLLQNSVKIHRKICVFINVCHFKNTDPANVKFDRRQSNITERKNINIYIRQISLSSRFKILVFSNVKFDSRQYNNNINFNSILELFSIMSNLIAVIFVPMCQ